MLAFRCFAAHAQHHKDRVQSSRSIAASLEHTWGAVEFNGDDKPSQSCVTDSVFLHHASSVRNIELKRFSASSACQAPLSLHQANNVSTLGVYRCSPASLVCDALHACSSNLTDLTLEIDVIEEASEHLASALATCSKLEKFAIGYCKDIALPSLDSVVKSLSRSPTLKSIVFTSVPVLGSNPAALSLLLGNVARCSLLEELVLYKCGMWTNDFSDLNNDQAWQFIHAVNAHGGINVIQFDGGKVPSGSPVLKAVSYDYGKAQ